MKGLELSERYFNTYGLPMLRNQFPQLLDRVAAGLVGQGSDCLGFDDEISTDHDFGPGFCLWLNEEDYEKFGAELSIAYEALPKDFLGVQSRIISAQGDGRVGVFEIHAFYRRFIGNEQPPRSHLRWLYLPDLQLANATNGRVFYDPSGAFSAIRNAISTYPEDVRIKKIAARVAIMAQSGQYNYARSMRRGEFVAAELALREFVQATVSVVHALNHCYTPYYKWMFHSMKRLPVLAPTVASMLEELFTLGCQRAAWIEQTAPDFNPYVNVRDRRVVLIEEICRHTVAALQVQGLSDLDADFLEAHAWEIVKRIKDPQLRRIHVMEGA